MLVVAPASLCLIWAEEVEKWLPGLVRPAAIHVVEGRADRIRSSSHPFQVHPQPRFNPAGFHTSVTPHQLTKQDCQHASTGVPTLMRVMWGH